MSAVQQHLQINVGIVKMVCEGLDSCKSGVSKKDGHSYRFEYIKQDDLPDNYNKSSNIRPQRISNEDKKKHNIDYIKKWQKRNINAQNVTKLSKIATSMFTVKNVNSQKQ